MLTTRQRDILQLLLDAKRPLAAADLAQSMHLTPRQVSYGLQGLKQWLAKRQLLLKVTPGVGVELDCSAAENASLAPKGVTQQVTGWFFAHVEHLLQ